MTSPLGTRLTPLPYKPSSAEPASRCRAAAATEPALFLVADAGILRAPGSLWTAPALPPPAEFRPPLPSVAVAKSTRGDTAAALWPRAAHACTPAFALSPVSELPGKEDPQVLKAHRSAGPRRAEARRPVNQPVVPRQAAAPSVFAATAIQSAGLASPAPYAAALAKSAAVQGPPAEPVESLALIAGQPAAVAYPVAATILPELAPRTLEVETRSEPLPAAAAVGAPLAEPVETLVLASAHPEAIPYAAAAPCLPVLALATVEAETVETAAEPLPAAAAVRAPQAEPVETLVLASAHLEAIPYAAAATRLPVLALAMVEAETVERAAEPLPAAAAVRAPQAEPVETLVLASAHLEAIPYAAAAARPPVLALSPAQAEAAARRAPLAATATVREPQAEPLETLVLIVGRPEAVPSPVAADLLPQFLPSVAPVPRLEASAEPARAAQAEAAESLLPALPEPLAVPYLPAAVRLPALALAAAEMDALPAEPEQEPVPPPSEIRMPGLAPAEVMVDVWPSVAAALPAHVEPQWSGLVQAAIAEPRPIASARWMPSLRAEPAEVVVRPRVVLAPLAAAGNAVPCLPDLANFGPAEDTGAGRRHEKPVRETAPLAPQPAESTPSFAAFCPAPAAAAEPVQIPRLTWAAESRFTPAGFEWPVLAAAGPAAAQPNADAARLDPLPTVLVAAPEAQAAAQAEPVVPQAGLVPLEFYCQRIIGAPFRNWEWQTSPLDVIPPHFALRPVFERLEDLAPAKPKRKDTALADVFDISEANRRRQREFLMRQTVKAIAAGFIVTLILWFGATTQKALRNSAGQAARREVAAVESVRSAHPGMPSLGLSGSSGSAASSGGASSSGGSPSGGSSAGSSGGPLAWLHNTLAKRATVELTDGFRNGMEAWGAAAKSWAPGWTKHPEGYVSPGDLALFRPSLSFSDYRLEFFGQIESKSMDWVVRAHDPQNFYAMKVKVIEPGLRPIISVVHYPVIGGKSGHRVETPLSVMVHNNTPIEVAVDVKGNHVTTSIDGQEVDSWTDTTLVAGGVGFFSDVGERSRLYWMKVAKNQDVLGRICSYLTGGSGESGDVGELWPSGVPQPGQPDPLPHVNELALAVTAIRPRRRRSTRKERF